ncbi:hypothetical protein DBR47_08535 [Paucibacter sp. KBW04]|uniref:hypothetical protein n=1 Tax=Paucibacter sp. KBW04 TaxID=2153361 RepID=UPI000F585038|nr:hypothetical protein [Paucibacter sp. KBW04]RQO60402.1 hypothetical protein DBR47_08535 [Paucibacter sp. KBW04]
MQQRFQRTEAGRAEVKARSQALSRSARNLLLVMDASRPGAEWLSLVQGATEADLQQLQISGLIADPTPGLAEVSDRIELPAAQVSPMAFEELYGFLTRHAKQYLGLMKGYRMVLEVERCADLPALQALTQRFVQEVQLAQGEQVAEQVRRALGLGKS